MKAENDNIMLDCIKGFACIGVVFMHIMFPGLFGRILKLLSAYAVPVFFMIAGYYAWEKDEKVIRR